MIAIISTTRLWLEFCSVLVIRLHKYNIDCRILTRAHHYRSQAIQLISVASLACAVCCVGFFVVAE